MSHQDGHTPAAHPTRQPQTTLGRVHGAPWPEKPFFPKEPGHGNSHTPAPGTASHCQPCHLGRGWGPPAGRAPRPWPCGAHSTGSSCQWLQVAQWGWVSSCPSSVSSGLNDRRHWLVRQSRRQGCFLRTSQPLSHPQGKQRSVKTLPELLQDKAGMSQRDFFLSSSCINLTL